MKNNVLFENGKVSKKKPQSRQPYAGLVVTHSQSVTLSNNRVRRAPSGDFAYTLTGGTTLADGAAAGAATNHVVRGEMSPALAACVSKMRWRDFGEWGGCCRFPRARENFLYGAHDRRLPPRPRGSGAPTSETRDPRARPLPTPQSSQASAVRPSICVSRSLVSLPHKPTSHPTLVVCVLTETDKHASSPPLVPYVSAGCGREAERSVPLVGPTSLHARPRHRRVR